MEAKQAREKIEKLRAIIDWLRISMESLEQARDNIKHDVDMPRPGALVKSVDSGHIFRVVNQNGEVLLDTGGDDGLVKVTASWARYDVIQDGAPELPGAPKGVT